MQAHLHVQGILQDVETHRTVKKLLDLPEKIKVQIVLIIIGDLSGLTSHLVKVQVIYKLS